MKPQPEHRPPARASLTPSQRAYLFRREDFLAGIQERAKHLFENGYRVFATAEPFLFVVTFPRGDGERGYFVNPVAGVCSCPFHREQRQGQPLNANGSPVPCKHLLGLPQLVEQTVCEQRAEGDMGYFRLRAAWLAVRAKTSPPPRPGVRLWDEEGGVL